MSLIEQIQWDFDPINEPLAEIVYRRTYSRTKENGTQETWRDTVERVVDGNLALVPEEFHEDNERERLCYLIGNKIAIPAGRHLWSSGANTTGTALFNCHRAGWSTGFSGHCGFNFEQLMLGGGVGANFSSEYYAKMKPFLGRIVPRFVCRPEHKDIEILTPFLEQFNHFDPLPRTHHKIADSREGWVAALRLLLDLSVSSVPQTILFDVSEVRPAGSLIKGFGGTASGPLPLIQMLNAVAALLHSNLGHRPNPLLAMEIDHETARCVVAGNVRRSARMSILHWKDPYIFDFIHCKEDQTKHWTTNISVEVDDEFFAAINQNESHAMKVLNEVITGMLRNGEPGFYNSALASKHERGDVRATNPCGEIPLEEWEACILGHVNLARGTAQERDEAFHLMARFLVRATFAPKSDPKQEAVVLKNRRIGVGFFGLQEWMAQRGLSYKDRSHHRLEENLKHWYNKVRRSADLYCLEMGIPIPVATTTVAPTGTIAKLAGTTEGLQSIHSPYFIRRVRFSDTDPNMPKTYPMEPCLYNAATTVVSIPCVDPVVQRIGDYVAGAMDITIEEMMHLQAVVQENYADNSISVTIQLPSKSDPQELREAILAYLPRLKGMTCFPALSRDQSPLETITREQYNSLNHKTEQIHYSDTDDSLIEECASGACPIK